MLTHLMESIPQRRRNGRIPGTAVSFAVHVALVYGAVAATRERSLSTYARPIVITDLHYENGPDTRSASPEIDVPNGWGLIVAPPLVPISIESPNPDPVWDPRRFDPYRVYLPVFPPIVVTGGSDSLVNRAYMEGSVDERPEVVTAFSPEYPDLLRQAGIEGVVMVEAIVDTMGRAEPASIRVVQSSNQAFEPSARAAALRTIYRPGRVSGRPVRVLVQVPISFSIRR
jgi:periplasmic protein TonB